ncbi:MAG TPA: cbb3-type cytochrome c oxidase subunit I [Vicinamibacterales bacterium]|nr:cbb3-type cytochrome c oxidase subunit I [Vicinamibacterales bacterium]
MRMFSTDHKVIGLQYALTSLAFLLIGFLLILLVRWQLAWPDAGTMLPEFYNQLGAMHGTIMVFLAVVPLAVGGFGNYLVPTMIGAPDMAFPRLNMWSYWLYFCAGAVMVASFFLPGGAAASGWTSYAPLSILASSGQTAWLIGMCLLIVSSLFGSINIIVTILQLREPGLTMMRLPFFIWSQLVTAFLLLLAFPPLQAAAILQLMDRLAGSSFFLPSGLVVSGKVMAVSGGGSPILWQHLFWFLAHPEVYVLILPAFGIVSEVITATTRRPLWGYRGMVMATLFMGFMSFIVWAHHMFLTGMGPTMSAFFQVTTMIISIPSVIILSSLFLSLHGGSIRFTVPALFALAFLPMFGLGGLTGLPLGLAASDIPLHDTYYVIGHFHYIVAPGTLFALFAGIYHWFPTVTGRTLNARLGKLHFWGSLVAMNLIFMPMFAQGLAGLNRRLFDGGRQYAAFTGFQFSYELQAWAAVGLGLVQLIFIANLAISIRRRDPHRGTGVDLLKTEFSTDRHPSPLSASGPDLPRSDTGVTSVTLGIWLFIASEVMLFGALFSSYTLLRVSAANWPVAGSVLNTGLGWTNTALLMMLTVVAIRAGRARPAAARGLLLAMSALAAVFLGIKGLEYRAEWEAGLVPATSTFMAMYYTLTGVHAVHVIGGILANLWVMAGTRSLSEAVNAGRLKALSRYWVLVDVVWLIIFVGLYLK